MHKRVLQLKTTKSILTLIPQTGIHNTYNSIEKAMTQNHTQIM